MDRDMVNCLHYLYQWGQLSEVQLDAGDPERRLFWCDPDTRHPLAGRKIVLEDPQTGDMKLSPGVYELIDMIESQLRSMPKPDFAFGFPISAAIRAQGKTRPAFLAISYAPQFEPVKLAVKEAAALMHFEIEVTGDLSAAGNIMDQVWQGIRGADAVVADVTGKNPNVFYEIGLPCLVGEVEDESEA